MTSDLYSLEEQLKKNDLTFEEQLEIRDQILREKTRMGQHKPIYEQIKCIGCSG